MNQVITNLLEKKKVKERLPINLKKDPEFQRRISRYSILSPVPRRSKFAGIDDSSVNEKLRAISPFSLPSDRLSPNITLENIP